MKKKNVVYIRVALNNDDDVNNQINKVKDYTKSLDIIIDDIYIDNGYSGLDFDRPAWNTMLDKVSKGEIDTIYISEISRLGRDNKSVFYYMKDYFPKHNVKVVDTTGRNQFFENIGYYNRYFESKNLQENIR